MHLYTHCRLRVWSINPTSPAHRSGRRTDTRSTFVSTTASPIRRTFFRDIRSTMWPRFSRKASWIQRSGVRLNPGGRFIGRSDFAGSNGTRAQNFQLNLIHIFRPTLLVELKASAARTAIQSRTVNDGLNVASALGFPCNALSCVNLGDDQTYGIPRMLFGRNQYQELGDVSFVP